MNRISICLPALIFFILASCQTFPDNPPVDVDGEVYGVVDGLFKHRWWNYYERGRSFAEGKLWRKAEIDFSEAIRQNGRDQRRVPTYGRHLTDYFPRRELGIALFRQGRISAAERELECSLSQEKSARAEFYLDQARRAKIEEEALDHRPPVIFLTSPKTGQVTNRFSWSVSGAAADDTYVASVRINGQKVPMDLSAPRVDFEVDIPLKSGANPIRVEAADLVGKVSQWETVIHCDRNGPVVGLSIQGGRLRGYAHDESVLRAIRIDGEGIALAPETETVFDYPLSGRRLRELAVVAEDIAGNRTRRMVPVGTEPATPLRGILNSSDGGAARISERLGRYHALVVGINDYANGWPPLQTARADAEALADILTKSYRFAPSDVYLLLDGDATWQRVVSEMRRLAICLEDSDNLLIFFAGHGELDATTRDGYWVPVDGRLKDPSTWITNSAVRAVFSAPHTRLKNLLIIADSCYSGTLLLPDRYRPPPSEETSHTLVAKRFIRKSRTWSAGTPFSQTGHGPVQIAGFRPSRQIIASGGIQPVTDAGRNGHSLFAGFLLKALRTNTNDYLDADRLFHERLWPALAPKNQRPQFGRLDCGVDQDGQFVFWKGAAPKVMPRVSCSGKEPIPVPEPPKIHILSPQHGHVTFSEAVVIDLQAETPNGIQWISIDGERVVTRPGRTTLSTSHARSLSAGENRIVIRCGDQIGCVGEKELTIFRKIPAVLRPEHRMPLLWRSFEDNETGAGAMVRYQLNRLNRFQIFLSGIGDPAHIRQTPHFLLNGNAILQRDGATLVAEILDGDNGAVLKTLDVYSENELTHAVVYAKAGELALKIADAFPRTKGKIQNLDTRRITLDRGASDRLFPGLWVIFFDELAENLLSFNQGKIRSVAPQTAEASASPAERLSELRPGMGFIVK